MGNKAKIILETMILLLLTYFLSLGIFLNLNQGKVVGGILGDNLDFYKIFDYYDKPDIPDNLRCVGSENTSVELLDSYSKYGRLDSSDFNNDEMEYDVILFYNNVKDNLKIDVDLANYDMSSFKSKYPGKTIFPIVISSDYSDKYKIGDEYRSFDFTKTYKPIIYSFIVVGYNDYSFTRKYVSVVNQVDYAKLQNYVGIYSMFDIENLSLEFKNLESQIYPYKINFDDTYYKDYKAINGGSSWHNLKKSSVALFNVPTDNDSTTDRRDYLVGRKPVSADEIVLSIDALASNPKSFTPFIQDYLDLGDSIDIKLFTNKDYPSISKTLKVVGFYVDYSDDSLILSDALFDEIQSKITYKNYDTSIDKSNFKVVNQRNAYLSKQNFIDLAIKSNPTTISEVMGNSGLLVVFEVFVIIITIGIAINYMKTKKYVVEQVNGYPVTREVEINTSIYTLENFKIKLYILIGVFVLTLIISLLLMHFSNEAGINIYTTCWSYGALIAVVLIEEIATFIIYRLSSKKS